MSTFSSWPFGKFSDTSGSDSVEFDLSTESSGAELTDVEAATFFFRTRLWRRRELLFNVA